MTTNRDWLYSLEPSELSAWFDAEHVENTIQEQVNKLTIERDNLADDLLIANKQREWYREKFGKCIDYADAIHALMDEGLA